MFYGSVSASRELKYTLRVLSKAQHFYDCSAVHKMCESKLQNVRISNIYLGVI